MLRIMFLFLVFGLLACSPAERPADKSVLHQVLRCSKSPEPTGYTEYFGALMAEAIPEAGCSERHLG